MLPLSALEQAVQQARLTSTSQTPAAPLTTAAAPFALSTQPDSAPAASSADHQIQLPQRRQQLCEHNRQKSRCRECGGLQIFEHNRRKDQCRACGGSQICEHNRLKSTCRACKETQRCGHGQLKYFCSDCGGAGLTRSIAAYASSALVIPRPSSTLAWAP